MASISKDPNGRRTIQFIGADGKRRSLRLGKVSHRTAEAVKLRVEHLAGAGMTGHALDGETARWVADLDTVLTDKLAAVGLIPKRERTDEMTLGAFLDAYIKQRTDADKVLAECPDAQWKLLFALSRFGGLRCPSEHLALRWGDIDWERGRFTVHSPKTEHHEGGVSRVVPIFPELRPYLEAAWDEAPEGTEHVITRYRQPNVNLRTQLLKIIKRTGLTAWPRLFHNLRATRQTELAADFPLHVVCEWIGNSKLIAQEHYLRVTDADFDRAVAKEVQNPVQQAHEPRRIGSQPAPSAHEKNP